MSVFPMTTFKKGKPSITWYTPSAAVNMGDVIVVGNRPFIATSDNPGTNLQGTAVVTYSVMEVAVEGGIYLMQADAAYQNGTYVYWNPTSQQVTASGTAGGSCVPFGWIVGGPGLSLSDGGPTGAASNCLVFHDPTDDTNQILGCSATTSDIVTNTGSATAFATQVTIPAGTLIAGDTVHVHAAGAVTGQNSTNTNLIILNALTAANTNTTFLNTTAVNAAANTAFILDGDFMFQAVGNLGIVNFVGEFSFGTGQVRVNKVVYNTAINTNLGITISVVDTQSAASTSNTAQLFELLVNKVRR